MLLSLLLSPRLLPGAAHADGHSERQGVLTHPGLCPGCTLNVSVLSSLPLRGVTVLRHWNFIICFWEELAGAGICVGSKAIAEQYV